LRKEGELTSPNQAHAALASTSLLAQWRWWIIPALIALALSLIFTDPFIGDWDALDYTLISIDGRPSSMALGRTLFIFANHGAWRAFHTFFGLSTENAYLLFKYMIVVETPLAIIACWTLAREVTASLYCSRLRSSFTYAAFAKDVCR
jgi:hypothetical protein